MKPLFILLFLISVIHANPLLTSWHTDSSTQYARIYESTDAETANTSVTTWSRGLGVQNAPTYAGVHEISQTDTDVYVRTTGLGSHIMGPWYLNEAKTNLFPNFPSNQAIIYRLPKSPGTVPTTKTLTGLGRIGLFVDGVSMFDSRDAFSYDTSAGEDEGPNNSADGDGIWNRDAFVNEAVTFDAANAHQAGNNYHYHANPVGLRHILGDSVDYDPGSNTYTENFNGMHSPILGWVRDGYPVYGPYGYSDPTDPESEIRRMSSGFQKRNITQRQTLPAYAARDQNRSEILSPNEYGPDISPAFTLGHYLEDYEYLGDLGLVHGDDFDLDLHNGRFCVTPEFPDGTFVYFVCIEEDGTPKFPYNIGRTFYGNPVGNVAQTLPADASIIFEGGPEHPLTAKLESLSDEITITWNAAEGGTYVVEASDDLDSWGSIPSTPDKGVLSVTEALEDKRFFRTNQLSLASFDDTGFAIDTAFQGTQNNVLLIIVDDLGIDSSPLDNPSVTSHASMPTLQSMADQGVRFTNAYAQPTCSPTRANILTGRYSFRHGVGSPGGVTFPTSEFTLPDAFAAASSPYALSAIGKWHLGGGDNGPQDLAGWNEFRGTLNSGVNSYYDWSKTINGVTTPNVTTYTTTDQINDAVSFINSQGDNPWFCWLALNAPHGPFQEPPADLVLSNSSGGNTRGTYERMLEAMDTELARLLETVDLSTTNILLIGDNGTPGNVTQAPFAPNKAKTTLYEGGTHVPFIALGPDVRARGTREDLVHCADIYSTILELAGIEHSSVVPEDIVIDSRSLFGVLNNSGSIEGGIVVEAFGNTTDPGRAIRIGNYKLILYDDGREELYDVVADPSEGTDFLLNASLTAAQQAAYDLLVARNAELETTHSGTTATGILSATPSSGVGGTSVTLTINLDPAATNPAVPGIANSVASIRLGTVSGTSVSRPSRHVVEATFTLPEQAGEYEIEIIYGGPQARTFGLNNAFTVTTP